MNYRRYSIESCTNCSTLIKSIHIILHCIWTSWIGYSSTALFRVVATPFLLLSICLIHWIFCGFIMTVFHIYSWRSSLKDYLKNVRDHNNRLQLLLNKKSRLVSINHSTWNQQLPGMCDGNVKSKNITMHGNASIVKQTCTKLVYSVGQQKALEMMAKEMHDRAIKGERASHSSLNYRARRFC